MKANEYQIGGNHYSQAGRYQHWDFVEDHGIGYLEGYATKYLVRWDKKGVPVQDLEKSLHTTKKLYEIALGGKRVNRAQAIPTPESIGLFCSANKVSDDATAKAIEILYRWMVPEDLLVAIQAIEELLESQPSQRIRHQYAKGGKQSIEQDRPFGYEYEPKDEDIYKSAASKIWSAPGAAGVGSEEDKPDEKEGS